MGHDCFSADPGYQEVVLQRGPRHGEYVWDRSGVESHREGDQRCLCRLWYTLTRAQLKPHQPSGELRRLSASFHLSVSRYRGGSQTSVAGSRLHVL